MIVAAYLPENEENKSWMGWTLREFVLEVHGQFDDYGCNKEGSTSYHRLSSELVIYGAAYACGLLKNNKNLIYAGLKKVPHVNGWGGRPLSELDRVVKELSVGVMPEWFWRRLKGMSEFVAAITKPDGTVPQIGDNDSGRFIKISSATRCLDHRHIIDAFSSITHNVSLGNLNKGLPLESKLLKTIGGDQFSSTYEPMTNGPLGHANDLNDYIDEFNKSPQTHKQIYEFELPKEINLEKIALSSFQEFGLFVMKAQNFYVSFRCGPTSQYGLGGHFHQDQLCLELLINGENLVQDPGSYIYTPIPSLRNEYRSLRAHFVPWSLNFKKDYFEDGLFVNNFNFKGQCLYFQKNGMVGIHHGFDGPTFRIISLENTNLVVRDFSKTVELERCTFQGHPSSFKSMPFSDNYGSQLR